MGFKTWTLEEAGIRLIDGDRGKNYPKQADFSGEGHCLFLSAKNVTPSGFQFSSPVFIGEQRHNLLRAGTLERGDIVMTTRGTIGNVAYYDASVDYPVIRINSGMMIFRADPRLWNKRFLYYVLSSQITQEQITSLTSGSAVPQLPARDLKKFELPKVPLSVQNQIESVISSLSDKLATNHRINQTLEQMAQALFKHWFVDFEPVKAKVAALEAGGSDEDALLAAMEAVSGKTAEQLATLNAEQPERYAQLRATAELFPSAMQDSELGEIPAGWTIGTVADLLELNPRRTLRKGAVAPYLDMKNVPTSGHLADEVTEREMGSGTKFINGDTLMARITPCLENGKTAFVDFLKEGETGWGSTEYIVLRPKPSYPLSLGYFMARNEAFRSTAIQSMTGTSGRQRANAKALADLDWVIYPEEIVDRFDAIAGGYLRLAKSYGDQSRSLAQTRDTLLPKLLSGELTLPSTDEAQSEPQDVAHV